MVFVHEVLLRGHKSSYTMRIILNDVYLFLFELETFVNPLGQLIISHLNPPLVLMQTSSGPLQLGLEPAHSSTSEMTKKQQ